MSRIEMFDEAPWKKETVTQESKHAWLDAMKEHVGG